MGQQFDFDKFRKRAYRKKKALAAFLKKFKRKEPAGLQKLIKQADAETWQEVACLDCAACCKRMTPTFTRTDIKRISAHFGMTSKQFYDKWLAHDDNGDVVNENQPCQFLGKDNKCSIYSIRPSDCAGFPHFVRKDFAHQAAEGVYTNNLHRCPATLIFVEKLEKAVATGL
jgi:Fe-S-cluster containining protein